MHHTASSNELPMSTSMVVLRVGARLQLRCTNRVLSWSKDGVSLVDGFKYSIDSRMLTVRHTGMLCCDPHISSVHEISALCGETFTVGRICVKQRGNTMVITKIINWDVRKEAKVES